MLLANILECDREKLILMESEEVAKVKEEAFFEGIGKIAMGYPLQYIICSKEFMGMNFFVNEDVLVPRADTEILVQEVIDICGIKKNILELCTGSGVIAISLAKYLKDIEITASDISEKALKVAKHNCDCLVPSSKINFIKSDMFDNVKGEFDIIVSNPPYIKTNVIQDYDLKYEPYLALDGGEDGLKFYRIIINEGYKYIKENGIIALEIGYDQKEDVINLVKLSGKYKKVFFKRYLAVNDRFIIIYK